MTRLAEKTMNSDELGAWGESRFQALCAEAHLICNEATRDRAGWDFIVQFPFPPSDNGTGVDNRPIPMSCYIQVKTLWDSSNTIKPRLSSAERLAKEPIPSFIYIFKVLKGSNPPELLDSLLIHLVSDPLAEILKKLRKERAAGRESEINHRTISISAKRFGKPIPLTGLELSEALQRACGTDMHKYSLEKHEQLKNLGFDEIAVTGKFRFQPQNWEEVVDFSLGLKERLAVTQFETHEVRFGISLPLHKRVETGELTFEPEPVDRCTVIVRHRDIFLPTVMEGKMYVPAIPGIPYEHAKMLIRCDEVRLTMNLMGELAYTFEEDFHSRFRTATEWSDIARMLLAFALGEASVEITPNARSGPMIFRLTNAAEGINREHASELFEICENLGDLCKRAGATDGLLFHYRDLRANALEIGMAKALMDGDARDLSFHLTPVDRSDIPSECDTVFIKSIPFGDYLMVYYGVAMQMSFQESDDGFFLCRSSEIVRSGIRFLKRDAGGFERLVSQIRADTGVNAVAIIDGR